MLSNESKTNEVLKSFFMLCERVEEMLMKSMQIAYLLGFVILSNLVSVFYFSCFRDENITKTVA